MESIAQIYNPGYSKSQGKRIREEMQDGLDIITIIKVKLINPLRLEVPKCICNCYIHTESAPVIFSTVFQHT